MLSTSSIKELSTTRPDLYAFRVQGTVSRADMTEMARHMNTAFDAHDNVDMLLYFEDFEGSKPDAGLDLETVKSQLRSLSSVRRYVVANAPDRAADMVEAFGKILPVETEAYDDLDAAFQSLDAKTMTTTGQPAA
ncbi:MAG: STAS/SEC14 domain-containing protein [Roseobacter sp.]